MRFVQTNVSLQSQGIVHTCMGIFINVFHRNGLKNTHQQYLQIILSASNCICRLSGDVERTLKEFSKSSSLSDLEICLLCGLKAKLHRKSYVCKNAHVCVDRLYITTYIPWYVGVDGCIHKVRGQQMADEQQHSLEAFALHKPQVADGRHRCPIRPQERHGTQDGSQGFGSRRKDDINGWETERGRGGCESQWWHVSAANTHPRE